jgi:hypothetical protein
MGGKCCEAMAFWIVGNCRARRFGACTLAFICEWGCGRQLGETEATIFQLPNGAEALDLRRWLKIAEFPAFPMLNGDWDDDGRMELLLRRRFGTSSPHDILYFVRCDGRKVRWAKILPPSPARALHALPLKGRNGAAVFVVWQLEDKVVVEWLKWR